MIVDIYDGVGVLTRRQQRHIEHKGNIDAVQGARKRFALIDHAEEEVNLPNIHGPQLVPVDLVCCVIIECGGAVRPHRSRAAVDVVKDLLRPGNAGTVGTAIPHDWVCGHGKTRDIVGICYRLAVRGCVRPGGVVKTEGKPVHSPRLHDLTLAHVQHELPRLLAPSSIATVENGIHVAGIRRSFGVFFEDIHERLVCRHIPHEAADGDCRVAQSVLGLEGNTRG
mmetsp:Transcript_84125/g.123019  ORF Transcript_84125/g.123019 Transcript_84125/m.123019 type:complete len:224 (+) Transcript_84125:10950-11621(+)